MEIQEFRVVLRARDFVQTNRFYGEVLGLPGLASWDSESGRGALYQAGSGLVEVRGRPSLPAGSLSSDEFSYQGPLHKMTLTLSVPSAEKAYEELLFRDRNIPGGLKEQPDGKLCFETHDPDGIKILFLANGD
ncbi:MAG: VOC family protein [Acidobacteriota bacterium]|nr:VOC family protein [Acidobacteriota bacterium]